MRRMYSEKQIDSQIKSVIESGQVDNAKPIYCHPISIIGVSLRLTCLIFNNDSIPFTKTTFIDYIDSLYQTSGENIRIMTSGSYTDNTKTVIACNLGKNATTYFFTGIATDGTDSTPTFNKTQFENMISQFYDGVNKIN